MFGSGLLRLDMKIIFRNFAEKASALNKKVFGYPLAMQINITTDLFFEKTRI